MDHHRLKATNTGVGKWKYGVEQRVGGGASMTTFLDPEPTDDFTRENITTSRL